MKKLLFFLCLLTQPAFSQASRIDSLKWTFKRLNNQLSGPATNTLRAQTLKAIMRSFVEHNADSAIHYNNLLIQLCREAGLEKELIYAHYYTGLIQQIQGKDYESIRSFYRTLAMAEAQKQYTQMATLYGGLAHAYSRIDKPVVALKLCQQGLAILQIHSDSAAYNEQLSLLNTAGVIYRKLGRFDEALTTNQAMYELARTKPYDLWYEAHGLHAIGLVHKAMNQLPQALKYHQQALRFARKTGSAVLEGNILVNTADLFIKQKQWEDALYNCVQARQIATRIKNSNILAEANEKLYVIYKNRGEAGKALKAYEDFIVLKDSLSKEQMQQRIRTLQVDYDNVQKTNALQRQQVKILRMTQSRNALQTGLIGILLLAVLLIWNNRRLQTKNQKINQQRTLLVKTREQLTHVNKTLESRVEERTNELLKANQELIRQNEKIKEALFKGQTIERKRVALELHDNLSSLLSAVNMSVQSINAKNLTVSEQAIYRNLRQLIQNAYAEVRNISHNILPAELEREGIVSALTTLVDRLNQTTSVQFSLAVVDLDERLPAEIEFNLYSITLELVNNALKHAQAAAVSIVMRRTDTDIHLLVTDDGVGLNKSQTKRGVGLQNIQTRLDALGGTFQTGMPATKGTRFDIKIPIETIRINGNFTKPGVDDSLL